MHSKPPSKLTEQELREARLYQLANMFGPMNLARLPLPTRRSILASGISSDAVTQAQGAPIYLEWLHGRF
jgi:hypothetical protein